LWTIRLELPGIEPDWRLAMIDLSLSLEPILTERIESWNPATARGLLAKNAILARASAGCGYLGSWEWRDLEPRVSVDGAAGTENAAVFMAEVDAAREGLDWGIAMVRAQYEPVEKLFTRFEPLARGFVDDRLRSTILAPFAEAVYELMRKISAGTSTRVDVPGLSIAGRLYGATTGFAVGTLSVITSPDSAVASAPDVIYALTAPPADTVSLAGLIALTGATPLSTGAPAAPDPLVRRTTGIPSAVMKTDSLAKLAERSGTRVLLAVSPRGSAVLKAADEMTDEEMTLAGEQRTDADDSGVETTAVDLATTRFVALDSLGSHAPGRICGPNITRLARLESVFPDKVRPGFVVPFGVFDDHLDEEMPRVGISYRRFLAETFDKAQQWRQDGELEAVIVRFVLMRLSQLAEAIRSMPVRGGFHDELRRTFDRRFGGPLGTVPVAVRGDVNLDDEAKQRIGGGPDAGVVNAISEAAVLQAIRDVWASVYSEAGYGRCLRLLSDPESLFPSVLIQTAVDVERSGAVVMEGLTTLAEDDVTTLFSPGAGGMDTGRWPETYLLTSDGRDILLAPTRESHFTVLSPAGGVEEGYSAAFAPVLSATERLAIRYLTTVLRNMLPAVDGFESGVTYVLEMGFGEGNVWLLQAVPLPQYARGRLDMYLAQLDRTTAPSGTIELDSDFPPAPPAADTSSVGAAPDSAGGGLLPEPSTDNGE
ncbi:MAG: PEP/pyruvate-binding domain-containing protein, partial [bacterium]